MQGSLPNLIGIGANRSGSSWVFSILKSHPSIYMAEKKELKFFSKNYQEGIDWYKSHFPAQRNKYQYIGEFSPGYMFNKDITKRIKKELPEEIKFIVILRNPYNKIISSYKKYLRDSGEDISLEEYIERNPKIINHNLYAKYLRHWFQEFDQSQFLILFYEEATKNPGKMFQELSEFLNVDIHRFDKSLSKKEINSSKKPKPYFLFLLGIKFKTYLERKGFNKGVVIVQRIGRKILFIPSDKRKIHKIDKKPLLKYQKEFIQDKKELEKLLNRKVPFEL